MKLTFAEAVARWAQGEDIVSELGYVYVGASGETCQFFNDKSYSVSLREINGAWGNAYGLRFHEAIVKWSEGKDIQSEYGRVIYKGVDSGAGRFSLVDDDEVPPSYNEMQGRWRVVE